MKIIVDSREKWKGIWAKKLKALGYDVEIRALEAGDFMTERCVFERKTTNDFIQSFRGFVSRKGGRLFDQMQKLIAYCERENKIPWLLIVGDFGLTKESLAELGISLNVRAVFGAIASCCVRYGVNVVWNLRGEDELLFVMAKIAEKVEEGKFGVPHRKSIRRVHPNRKVNQVANVLGVGPKIAERLVQKFGGLRRILLASDAELATVPGIGPATIARIKSLIGD